MMSTMLTTTPRRTPTDANTSRSELASASIFALRLNFLYFLSPAVRCRHRAVWSRVLVLSHAAFLQLRLHAIVSVSAGRNFEFMDTSYF